MTASDCSACHSGDQWGMHLGHTCRPSQVEVSQYGACMNGARAAHFYPVEHIEVQVRPTFAEQNDDALRIANEIADAAKAIARLRAELSAQDEQLELRKLERDRAIAALPPKAPVRLLGRGFVRFLSGRPWIMSKRETGFASFGVPCDSWDDLFRRFNVAVVEHGVDECGAWWAVENVGGGRIP